MLSLNDEGVVLEEDWGWPVSIVEMNDGEESLFWIVWCAAKDGDSQCECQSTPLVGTAVTKEGALEAWRFMHFEKRYQGRRRQ